MADDTVVPPEEILVRRARRGDVHAFEALYRASSGRVYALCLRMTGDPSLAEELTQEAFFRAWRKLDTFRGASAFSTWMHRLTVNLVLGRRRSRAASDDKLVAIDPQERPYADSAPTQPGVAVDLERAIARLPDRARTVFVLHDVEGYRHREIAELADMAIGTSKAHLNRARKLLREALS